MSERSTGYYYREYDHKLRHAHTDAVSVESWHDATDVHTNQPSVHDIFHSFSPEQAHWSVKNKDLSLTTKASLIRSAKFAHDANLSNAPTSANALEPSLEPTQAKPTLPAVIPPTPTDESDLTQRVNQVEQLSLAVLDKLSTTLTKTDQVQLTNNALSNTQRTIQTHLTQTDQDIKAALDTVAATNARLDTLEAIKRSEVSYTYTDQNNTTHTLETTQHATFKLLCDMMALLHPERRNVWLAGPAGSGKTRAVAEFAKLMGLQFKYHPAIVMKHELLGYTDVAGKYVTTNFREVYEHGGVVLLDECDGSSPEAMIALNGAISSDSAPFADGMVKRHINTYIFAAANTWGLGGDAKYMARFKQDFAFLDRFITIEWNYDETLESLITPQLEYAQEWVKVVRDVRSSMLANGAEFVVSPRASQFGCDLLNPNHPDVTPCSPEQVVNAIFGKYRKHDKWATVGQAAERFARNDKAQHQPVSANGKVPDNLPTKLAGLDFSKARVYGN